MSELDPLEKKVIELIAQKKRIPSEGITLDSTFLDLGIDSLDGMDLLFTFEESFKLTIPDDTALLTNPIAAEVPSFDPAAYLTPDQVLLFDRYAAFAMAAAGEAWAEAGLDLS